MIEKAQLEKMLAFTLSETNFSGLGKKYVGKVRDNYSLGDGTRIIITTDRLSAFDRVLTTIPFKGQVLNECSAFWFEKTKHIVDNHVIDVPDPNVTIAKECEVIPVEMVVRGYLTGSAWRDYRDGKDISGIVLPKGLRNWQKFGSPLVTPSTKAEAGLHDEHVSKESLVENGVVEKELLERMEKTALALFAEGTRICAKNGLILVDTKYEFGLLKGKLVVVDEMHTPDSSRYWFAETYTERFEKGVEPQILDKEFLRQWLIKEKNFMGDGPIPKIPDNIRAEVASRYITAFEGITGKELVVPEQLDATERIKSNLAEKGYL